MKHMGKRVLCACLVLLLLTPQALAYSKLKKGSKGTEVVRMQEALKSLGYSVKVDGKYGSATMTTVKNFQKKYGLTADGVAGNKTLTLLYSLVPGDEPAAAQPPSDTAPAGSEQIASGALTAVVTTTGGSLKFRAKASTASNVIVYANIPNGTRIKIKSKGSTWCTAVYNGKTGYVMTEYLTFPQSATATPKPATPTPKPANTGATTARVRTANGGSLNLRSAAQSGNNIISTVPNGAAVTVTARGKTWCAVIYNGVAGYVMSEYLAFGSAAAATPTPTAKPTAAPVNDPSVAYVTTANGKSLNLRSSASSATDNVVATIPNGTQLKILSKGATWCKTTYNGKTGYVMTAFLSFPYSGPAATATPAPATPTPTPSFTGAVTGYVNTSNGGSLNLRKSASDKAAVLAAIPNGAALTVTARGSTWCAVTYQGVSGYVMTKFLYIPVSYTTPSPATATPAPANDGSVYTRTLRSGSVGEDVRWVQTRLKELGYTVQVNSSYDSATVAAVKAFQSKNGLTSDGLAGAQTFAILACVHARRATDSAVTYGALNVNSTDSSSITAMQRALINLGYPLKATGEFDVDTHNAVVAFQVRNGLVISGIADGLTRTVLMGGEGLPYSTPVRELPANTGLMASPAGQVKLMHWQNEIKAKVKVGQKFLIFDPQTNLSWHLVFYSLGRHADSQPATWTDTQIMNRSFGNTSWTIHPVYVQLPTGEWTIATMHNRPHLYGSITNNGFGGHLCVHFLRTMSEAQQNDPDYGVQNQVTLRNAWKALSGETISY